VRIALTSSNFVDDGLEIVALLQSLDDVLGEPDGFEAGDVVVDHGDPEPLVFALVELAPPKVDGGRSFGLSDLLLGGWILESVLGARFVEFGRLA
jgi:hypothetical protein